MFSWLNKCWGGMGVTSTFEKARLQCTYPDWAAPDSQALAMVLRTFQGQNQETLPEAALNSFMAHLEHDEERVNGAFVLKNLLILDLVVEERLFLTRIGNYYNSQLLYQSGQGREMSSSIKDLIASYYVYIKEKARLYTRQSVELCNKRSRMEFMMNSPVAKILQEMEICFKIQTFILDVSDKFNRGNKSPELIQTIFSSLLKNYLFCYSIVSLAVKTFIARIPDLGRKDLEYLAQLTEFINREYTRNFLLFIERNKMIESFRPLKYNELIIVDDKVSAIIKEQLAQLSILESVTPDNDLIDLPLAEEINAGSLSALISVAPQRSEKKEDSEEAERDVEMSRRKVLLVDLRKSGQADEHYFTEYQNLYHESFKVDDEETIDPPPTPTPEKNFGSAIQSCPYGELMLINLEKKFQQPQDRRFSKTNWEEWENIYSSP